jgi:carboxyl-terminal processing protease
LTRARLALLTLALAALACNTLFPPATPTPAPLTTDAPTAQPVTTSTLEPTPTPASATATLTPSSPVTRPTTGGVRECAYVPGVSVPAEMPPEVVSAPTPTPYPLPPLPPNTPVAQALTDDQLLIFNDLWQTVNDNYLYADFNGRDWKAIGEKYETLIRGGLTDEDFYLAMDIMIAELGDEHSHFLSPAAAAEQDSELRGKLNYVGVGILWSAVPETGRGVIILTFPNSPAAEAGLGPHDSIVAVNGSPALDASGVLTTGVRGPEGTPVTLTIQRVGGAPLDVRLIRRRISGPLPIDYCLVPGTRIGYLFLPGLDDETIPEQMRAALEAFAAAGPLDGLVLDNRQNTGGAISVLADVLSFFTRGTVGHFVSHDDRHPMEIEPEDIGGSQSVPMAVLVDVDTASAGEWLSGILQNQGRAQVIGRTTPGNVETLWGYDFDDGSRAWIAHETFQPMNLPNAIWEQTGIEPEVSVPTRWDLFGEANDPALAAAVELLSKP